MAPDPGSVYVDDPTITDDELIYRMILTSNTKWADGVAVRAGTNAFQDRRVEELPALGVPAVAVSVFLGSEMARLGSTPAALVARWGSQYGIASITAGTVRLHGQGVVRWPTADDPEHGMIFVKQGSNKTGGQSTKLAKASTVVIAPPAP